MSIFRNSGYQFVRAHPGAQTYAPSLELDPPRKVDLRPLMTPVENQGRLQSCTANAIAGAYEYLIKKHTGAHVDLSRLFIYYNARWRNGEQHEDAGSVIQYGMESLKSFGACNEATWPYNPSAVLKKPAKPSYAEAEKFRVLDMQQVPVELERWKHCLAEGYPIVFGCALFESFDSCNDNGGVVPMPDPKEVSRGEHGRHAMLCVGYSDVDKAFIVRNSWGADWGDRGYCYMPYNYLMSAKLNGGDCWMLRGAENLPSPNETWIDDDRPLVKGFDWRRINPFPANAYDWIELIFFAVESDADYSGDVPADYVEYWESFTSETTYVEDYEEYVSLESEEEEDSEEEAEDEYSEEEEASDDEDEEEDEDSSDDEDDSEEEEDDEESDEDEEEEGDKEEEEGEEDEEEEEEEDDEEEDEGDEEEEEDEDDSSDDENDEEEEDDEDDGDGGDDDSGDDDDGGDDEE